MTVAPLIAMKSTKCDSLEAVGKELDRRAHTYANDVDQSGRHVGYLCRAGDESPVPLEQAIERRMGELNTKRKIRENQVRAMGFIVSSNDALTRRTRGSFSIGRFSGSGRGTDTRTCSPPRFIWTRAPRTRTSGLPQSSATRTVTIACAPRSCSRPTSGERTPRASGR